MLWLSVGVASSVLVSSAVAQENNVLFGIANGTIHTFPLDNCTLEDQSSPEGTQFWSLGPDDCLEVPDTTTSFRILEPAVCPNGTRTQLARYEGPGCNGTITGKGAPTNITNEDINGCQSLSSRGSDSEANNTLFASLSFHCDGLPENDEEVQKTGSISFNNCPVNGRQPRPPSFSHPEHSTCTRIIKGNELTIFRPATCPDGSAGKFATWYDTDLCDGDPDELQDVSEDMLRSCFIVSEETDSTFSFLCEENLRGNGVGPRNVVQGSVALLFTSFWLFAFSVSPIF